MKKENLEENRAEAKVENAADVEQAVKEEGQEENKKTVEEDTVKDEEVSELDKLKDEVAASKDKYLRLYSEFENFRRRTAKEKLDLVQTASEQLIVALLPILDDFQRAEKSFNEGDDNVDSMKEGFELIKNKFSKVLEQKGLKAMDDSQGIDFDPELHDAITNIPAPEEKLKGKVVDVVEKGYFLNDKPIRFAKVVIGN